MIYFFERIIMDIFLLEDIRYSMYQYKCKTSKQCETGDVCDRKQHVCRESHRAVPTSKAQLAKECLRKGIPIAYERGEHQGERKSREALRRCKTQKDRNVVQVNTYNLRYLPAPAAATKPKTKTKSETLFLRPAANELKTMRKDELSQIYKRGQTKGYIDPSKNGDELTNKQLMNYITRATQKKW
jgi:hypothetical protein